MCYCCIENLFILYLFSFFSIVLTEILMRTGKTFLILRHDPIQAIILLILTIVVKAQTLHKRYVVGTVQYFTNFVTFELQVHFLNYKIYMHYNIINNIQQQRLKYVYLKLPREIFSKFLFVTAFVINLQPITL